MLPTHLPILKFKARGDASPGDIWDLAPLLCPIRCSKFDLFQLLTQHCNSLSKNCSSFLKHPAISWHEKVPVSDKAFFLQIEAALYCKGKPVLCGLSFSLLYGRILRGRTGALVLREEDIDDLDFADAQGINQRKCKDSKAKVWHKKLTYEWNQR